MIMKHYTILNVSGSPDWTQVPELAIDTLMWTAPAPVTASAQICYNEEGFQVRMAAHEKDIRAEELGPTGMPCLDSCLEFFFCPVDGDPRYFNIEFNPNGCLFLGFGTGRTDRIRLLPEAISLSPQLERSDGCWQVTYQVPYPLIRVFFPDYMPRTGDVIHANCYKCGDLTPAPHYLLWNPSTSETPDYHRSCDFGEMRLG